MYCNACGKLVADDARYCPGCGAVVGTPRPTGKRLERSRTDRKVAGVCAGLAEHLGIDVTLMRLIWVFVIVMTGIFPGVIVYLLAWIVMPEEPETKPVVVTPQPVT
jgi:phage shock protein C